MSSSPQSRSTDGPKRARHYRPCINERSLHLLRALWLSQGEPRAKSVGEVAEAILEREYRRVQKRLRLRGIDLSVYLERARNRAGWGSKRGQSRSGVLVERREALNTLRNGKPPTVL